MKKNRKVIDIIHELIENESEKGYLEEKSYELIQELKGRRLTKEQKIEIFNHTDFAYELDITSDIYD